MATALELANRALRVLGEPKLTSFADTSSACTIVKDLFFTTFRKHMTDEDWFWARAREELTEDTTVTNLTELEYAYDLPSDMLIPRALYDENDNLIAYRIEADHLYTDSADDPKLVYTIDCVETQTLTNYPAIVSGYEDLIPDYWVESFAYTLAADIAFPITRDRQLAQQIRGEGLFVATKRAKELNALSQPGFGEMQEDWGGYSVAERRHPDREYD